VGEELPDDATPTMEVLFDMVEDDEEEDTRDT